MRGMQGGPAAMAMALMLGLGACSGPENPQLMNLRGATDGPDAFALVPTRPLEMPPQMAELPQPAPGGINRADPVPRADAIAALGGRPGVGGPADAALVGHTTRFGVAPGIRDQLATEDLEFRRRNQGRILERWFGTNVYHRAYGRQALDSQAELERWRRAGARTPSAPPAE